MVLMTQTAHLGGKTENGICRSLVISAHTEKGKLMTKFDDVSEAMNLLNNVKGSIENKIRTAYNLGYKQGFEDGKIEAVRSVYTWVFKEQDGERKEDE